LLVGSCDASIQAIQREVSRENQQCGEQNILERAGSGFAAQKILQGISSNFHAHSFRDDGNAAALGLPAEAARCPEEQK
jgi:hypothetical protein